MKRILLAFADVLDAIAAALDWLFGRIRFAVGSDNQAERAIEASELQEFMAGVMANYPDKQLAAPDDRHFIARRIIEAMRKEGRRWSI